MIWSIVRVMVLGLVRDRGALVMAFLLPPMIYLIFASIFASTTGDELRLRVAIYDAVQSAETKRLVAAIAKDGTFRTPDAKPTSEAQLRSMVRLDDADVGIVIRHDLEPRPSAAGAPAPILVIGDQAKAMASPIVVGAIHRILNEHLPDVTYRHTLHDVETTFTPFSPEQKGRVGAVLDAIKHDAIKKSDDVNAKPARSNRRIVEHVDISSHGKARAAVVYYAGAVSILFLLYSAMQSGMTLIDERKSGVLDRVLGGATSPLTLLVGKFLFLLGQGVVQASLIFAVAALLYDVIVLPHLCFWIVITVAAASTAAGIGVLLGTLCRTRQQAQTLSNFVVLVMSAIGGSMVPRFFLPPWLQQAGWLSPNTWVVEAYHGLLWREATVDTLLPLISLMLVSTVLTTGLAWLLLRQEAHRRRS